MNNKDFQDEMRFAAWAMSKTNSKYAALRYFRMRYKLTPEPEFCNCALPRCTKCPVFSAWQEAEDAWALAFRKEDLEHRKSYRRRPGS